jgi:hypothetical protein
MKTSQLPGGGKPWYVRRGTFWHCQVTPVSPAGWILISVYGLAAIAVSLVFLGDEGEAGLADWIVWAVLLSAATLLFLVTVFRMSVPATESGKGRRGSS